MTSHGEYVVVARPKGRQMPVRLSVSVSPADYANVVRFAQENGVPRALVIRKAIAEFIQRHDQAAQGELPLWSGGETSERARSA